MSADPRVLCYGILLTNNALNQIVSMDEWCNWVGVRDTEEFRKYGISAFGDEYLISVEKKLKAKGKKGSIRFLHKNVDADKVDKVDKVDKTQLSMNGLYAGRPVAIYYHTLREYDTFELFVEINTTIPEPFVKDIEGLKKIYYIATMPKMYSIY